MSNKNPWIELAAKVARQSSDDLICRDCQLLRSVAERLGITRLEGMTWVTIVGPDPHGRIGINYGGDGENEWHRNFAAALNALVEFNIEMDKP